MKSVLVIVAFLFGGFVVAQSPVDTTVYTVVEEMPQYPGGDEALLKYMWKNIKINPNDKCLAEGKLRFSFIIEKDGKLSNITCNSTCDNDKLLAPFKAMPAWTPGKQNGKPVRVKIMLPVNICIR